MSRSVVKCQFVIYQYMVPWIPPRVDGSVRVLYVQITSLEWLVRVGGFEHKENLTFGIHLYS